jgi:hypothetical protein
MAGVVFLVDLATGLGERGEDFESVIMSVAGMRHAFQLDSAMPALDGTDHPVAEDVFVDHIADFGGKAEERRRRLGCVVGAVSTER